MMGLMMVKSGMMVVVDQGKWWLIMIVVGNQILWWLVHGWDVDAPNDHGLQLCEWSPKGEATSCESISVCKNPPNSDCFW